MVENKTARPTPVSSDYPEIHNFMVDPYDLYSFKPPQDMMIDPFEKTLPPAPLGGMGRNSSNDNQADNNGFQYKQFYVARVVMIPCLVLMLLFSLLLVYIIIRHLRAIMKLYMSVIFYAFSIIYFALLMVVLLIHNQVKFIVPRLLYRSKR